MRTPLSKDQQERFSRQLTIKEFNNESQLKLINSSILVIGAGGLGSAAIFYLAAAGIGKIGIADYDTIELSNLNRQILHSVKDLNINKTQSAEAAVKKLSPETVVEQFNIKVDANNIAEVINNYDIIIDCVDNFKGKYIINDGAVLHKKPYIHGGVVGLTGQVMLYTPGGACLRCLIPHEIENENIPTSLNSGILGAAAGVIGSIQAAEAVKFITGSGTLLQNSLLSVDLLNYRFKTINFNKSHNCPICS